MAARRRSLELEGAKQDRGASRCTPSVFLFLPYFLTLNYPSLQLRPRPRLAQLDDFVNQYHVSCQQMCVCVKAVVGLESPFICVCDDFESCSSTAHKKCFHRRSIKNSLQPTSRALRPSGSKKTAILTQIKTSELWKVQPDDSIKSHVSSYWKRLSAVGPVHKARVLSLPLQNGS